MRILIVRLSAMGDIIHAMPAVAGLRAAFPESRIDWAIEERWSPLLRARPSGTDDDVLLSAAIGRGIDPSPPPFPIAADAERWADDLLAPSSRPFAITNPGAGWGAKCWPAERYRALVRTLGEHGIDTFVNAGPGEVGLAEAVVRGNESYARVLQCSLLQLIAVTRRAAL